MPAPSTPSRSPTCAQSARWQRSWREASSFSLKLSQPVASTAQAVTRRSRMASASDRLRPARKALGEPGLVFGIVVHVAADVRVPVAQQRDVAGRRAVTLADFGPVRPLAAILPRGVDLVAETFATRDQHPGSYDEKQSHKTSCVRRVCVASHGGGIGLWCYERRGICRAVRCRTLVQ